MSQTQFAEARAMRGAATDSAKQLIEARRMISTMIRSLRQAHAYFDGISALDQVRMKRMLRETIRHSEQFLGS